MKCEVLRSFWCRFGLQCMAPCGAGVRVRRARRASLPGCWPVAAQRAVLIKGGAAAAAPQGMIAGRFLAGIGIGLSSALVPLYISEVAARFLLSRLSQRDCQRHPHSFLSHSTVAAWLIGCEKGPCGAGPPMHSRRRRRRWAVCVAAEEARRADVLCPDDQQVAHCPIP